jgi:hypothetical protein
MGSYDIFIYHPQHNKNHNIHHKKKFIWKKNLSKKFRQKRANTNTHKSQIKFINRFIYILYKKKIWLGEKKGRTKHNTPYHPH